MRSSRTIAACLIVLTALATTGNGASISVNQTNLVTDDQSVNPALITDPHLVNPWGVSFTGGGSPFWVSDNGTGVATLYNVNAAGTVVTQNALVVSIPGDGTVTGQAFNAAGAGNFNGDNFLFVSEDGTVSGWRNALGTTAETFVTGSPANVYKGVTEATIGGNTYLFEANFKAGTIDITKGNAATPNFPGTFLDPTIPAGYAPFNIQFIGGKFYVTYALQDAAKHDDVAGPGNGFVSAFDANGNFLSRVASQGNLNSPWGLTIAPASFGSLAGDLLVGNFGDGRINAYNLTNNTFDGQLTTLNGQPLQIRGLWTLTIGGTGNDGSNQTVYFTAGTNRETHGLFGALNAVPEPSSIISGGIALLAGAMVYGRKRLRGATARA